MSEMHAHSDTDTYTQISELCCSYHILQLRGYVYLKETEIRHPMKGCRFLLTSPERQKTFCSVCPCCAVNDSLVRSVKTTCLQHLILILNKKLHTLNWSRSSLGNDGSCSTKSKIFCKAQLFLTGSYFCCCHLKERKSNKVGLELLEKLCCIFLGESGFFNF